jgi:hypothetical protein
MGIEEVELCVKPYPTGVTPQEYRGGHVFMRTMTGFSRACFVWSAAQMADQTRQKSD